MQRQQDNVDEAVDDLQDLNEQESGTDRADDEPWSPGTMDAMPMMSDIYTGANRRLVDARNELQRMQQANAMIPDAVGGMLALADPAAADAADSRAKVEEIMRPGCVPRKLEIALLKRPIVLSSSAPATCNAMFISRHLMIMIVVSQGGT